MTDAQSFTVDVEIIPACPVCGGAFSGLAVTGNEATLEGKPLYWWKCATCGAYALNPRMTDAFTERYYAGEYRGGIRPIHAATLTQASDRARVQMQLAGKYLQGETALDVGCSQGYLMGALYKAGFIVKGLDPDPDSVADYAQLSDIPPQVFDVITLSHTLEHFNHPREVLSTLIENYAHEGTRVLVDVPNLGTCNEAGVFQIHHPVAYDLPALTWLLESVGCAVIFNTLHGDGSDKPNNLLVVAEVR